MSDSLFLRALQGRPVDRPPVWIKRQAGRYLPEYRALRQKNSLWNLFHTPELAAEVTLQPVDLLGVDAAILFSDILVVAEMFGLSIEFPEGSAPIVAPGIQSAEDVSALSARPAQEALSYVKETIQLLTPALSVPLIGFCGGPFTVASYFIDRGGKGELRKTKQWLYTDPASFHALLDKITDASIAYLKMQIEAGVHAVQIFDSWANALAYSDFLDCSLRCLGRIVEALRPTGVPIILFCRGSSAHPQQLAALRPTAISFDWQKPMHELRRAVPSSIAVQGNFDPDLLRGSREQIQRTVSQTLASMKNASGYIVNLGHGVLPDTPVDNVRYFIELIKTQNA